MVGIAARMRVSSVTCPSFERHVEVHAHERPPALERRSGQSRLVSVRFTAAPPT